MFAEERLRHVSGKVGSCLTGRMRDPAPSLHAAASSGPDAAGKASGRSGSRRGGGGGGSGAGAETGAAGGAEAEAKDALVRLLLAVPPERFPEALSQAADAVCSALFRVPKVRATAVAALRVELTPPQARDPHHRIARVLRVPGAIALVVTFESSAGAEGAAGASGLTSRHSLFMGGGAAAAEGGCRLAGRSTFLRFFSSAIAAEAPDAVQVSERCVCHQRSAPTLSATCLLASHYSERWGEAHLLLARGLITYFSLLILLPPSSPPQCLGGQARDFR